MSFYLQIVQREGPFVVAQMRIKDYHPRCFRVSREAWSAKEYQRQWKEGIERLRTHPTSCLVLSVWAREKHVILLGLYKQKDRVIISQLEKTYTSEVLKNNYTPETCYNFIPPYAPSEQPEGLEEGEDYLEEWEVPLKDILSTKIEPWDGSKKFSLRILPTNHSFFLYRKRMNTNNNTPFYVVELSVGVSWSFWDVPLQGWNIEDYQQQWLEALERFKTEELSCLVHGVIARKNTTEVHFLPLYRKKETIFIQVCSPRMGDLKPVLLTTSSFTPDNCYEQLIPSDGKWYPRKQVTEWQISLKDALIGLKKSFPLRLPPY